MEPETMMDEMTGEAIRSGWPTKVGRRLSESVCGKTWAGRGRSRDRGRLSAGLVAVVLACGFLWAGPARASDVEAAFHKAYYLEVAEDNYAAAADLYEQIASASGAPSELRERARLHLRTCREEIAASDFARIMPPEPLAYIEINRPARQLVTLLRGLDLLGPGEPGPDGAPRRFSVSPRLVEALLGVRGVAVAVTGIDMVRQRPMGVAVFHPGDIELIRGIIETALPVKAQPVDPIGDYPVYRVQDSVLVCLTSRLVIVSPNRGEIENVVRRLDGSEERCLKTNKALAEVLADREDALAFFCVNAEPIMPLVAPMLAVAATQSREAAMAQALLDVRSLRTLTGKIGVSEDTLFVDLRLDLAEGHRNLVFNFLRMPPVDRDLLRHVPSGVAAMAAFSLNPADSRYEPDARVDGEPVPVVTAMDFGREVFANVEGVVAYVLPPQSAVAAGGPPIPDVVVQMTVRDPSKSLALWTQMLGLACVGAGTGTVDGTIVDLGGTQVHAYPMPKGVTVYLALRGNELVISPSRSAMERTLSAEQGGSILEDPAFEGVFTSSDADSTLLLIAHVGRGLEIGRSFARGAEAEWLKRFSETLSRTVVSADVTQSEHQLRLSGRVMGIPRVGGLVSALIEQRMKEQSAWRSRQASAGMSMRGGASDRVSVERQAFETLAAEQHNVPAAMAVGERLLADMKDDAGALNNFAWMLLTEDRFSLEYAPLALRMAERSNELTDHADWRFLDTLALAAFKTGDADRAVELEARAIDLCDDEAGRVALEQALARFESRVGAR